MSDNLSTIDQMIADAPFHEGEIVMSSRDIASETGKLHKNVIRDIEKMLDELDLGRLKFERTYQDSQNKTQKEYLLNKELTLTLVSGYSIKLRSGIIRRWQELEEAHSSKFHIPQTYVEALRLSADLAEKNETLKLKVSEDAPKVEFYERVTESKTVCQMAVAAQVAKLPFGRNILFRKLREKGVLMSGGKRHNLPKQQYITHGLFSVEESSYTSPQTDETFVSFTTHVTQKGIDWLIKHYGKEEVPK
jgi:Rha family phage regulatory protein